MGVSRGRRADPLMVISRAREWRANNRPASVLGSIRRMQLSDLSCGEGPRTRRQDRNDNPRRERVSEKPSTTGIQRSRFLRKRVDCVEPDNRAAVWLQCGHVEALLRQGITCYAVAGANVQCRPPLPWQPMVYRIPFLPLPISTRRRANRVIDGSIPYKLLELRLAAYLPNRTLPRTGSGRVART